MRDTKLLFGLSQWCLTSQLKVHTSVLCRAEGKLGLDCRCDKGKP